MGSLEKLKHLVNQVYPEQAKREGWPVCENHCFLRIIYDNLFEDCWYRHLDRKQPVISQLSADQLKKALEIAESLPRKINLLNNKSIRFRRIYRLGNPLPFRA